MTQRIAKYIGTASVLICGLVLGILGLFDSFPGILLASAALALLAWLATSIVDRRWRAAARRLARALPPAADPPTSPASLARAAAALRAASDDVAGRLGGLEQQLAEAQAAAARGEVAKQAFLGSVGHELRTPLNAIIGTTQLSMQAASSPQQLEQLQRVDNAAHGLLCQIDTLLDYVRIAAGDLAIEQEAFDLDGLLEAVADTVRISIGDKPLRLRVERDAGLPRTLIGDTRQLRQVLRHLADNAVKFTDEGEIVLAARRRDHPGHRPQLELEVRDGGSGIAATHAQGRFEPFSPGDSSRTRRHHGLGLGLSTCDRLLAAMGGQLFAERLAEGGSRVGALLPLVRPAVRSSGPERAQSQSPSRVGPIPQERRHHRPPPRLRVTGTRLRVDAHGDRLRRLLERFRDNYAGFAEDYEALHRADDRFGAAQLARALQSAAADLGAIELRDGAARLAIQRRSDDDPRQDLRQVRGLLDQLLSEIDQRLCEPSAAAQHRGTSGIDATLEEELLHLQDLLAGFDAAAINRFDALQTLLKGRAPAGRIEDLADAINRFDFTLAQRRLRELAADLGLILPADA